MYNDYIRNISKITMNDIQCSNFKSEYSYNEILEHVSFEFGQKYLNLIQTEFNYIHSQYIREFIDINDKFGSPSKYSFYFIDEDFSTTTISSSPTTLRYIYHALIILDSYKKIDKELPIVEVGCGYGGLFLAICYFSKKLNIHIPHYNIIDFPEVCNLIRCYITCNNDNITIPYSFYNCYEYGKDINSDNLFLISNYCFSEIEHVHRNNYIEILFKKVIHGFIIWQTISSAGPIENISIMNKNVTFLEYEKPQTSPILSLPNYFVYF